MDLGAYGIPRAVLEKKPFNAPMKGTLSLQMFALFAFGSYFSSSFYLHDEVLSFTWQASLWRTSCSVAVVSRCYMPTLISGELSQG